MPEKRGLKCCAASRVANAGSGDAATPSALAHTTRNAQEKLLRDSLKGARPAPFDWWGPAARRSGSPLSHRHPTDGRPARPCLSALLNEPSYRAEVV
jgi:hypothetical protein